MGRTRNPNIIRRKSNEKRTYNKSLKVEKIKETEKDRKARLKAEKKAKEEAEK